MIARDARRSEGQGELNAQLRVGEDPVPSPAAHRAPAVPDEPARKALRRQSRTATVRCRIAASDCAPASSSRTRRAAPSPRHHPHQRSHRRPRITGPLPLSSQDTRRDASKASFTPSCISRGALALKTRPKLGVPKVRFGRSKFARFRALKSPIGIRSAARRRCASFGPRRRPGLERRTNDAVAGCVAEHEGRRQRKRRRIEPALRGAPARGQIRIAKLVRALGGSGADIGAIDTEVHRERCPRLRQEYGVEAPAIQKGLPPRRSGNGRHFPGGAGDEQMAVIEARRSPFAA